MTTDQRPFSEVWAEVLGYDLRRAETAIAAVEKLRSASEDEDALFAAYFKGEAHGNSVRAAERRHDRAQHDAINAVYAINDERVKEASVDVYDERLLEALKTYRDEVAAKINDLNERGF